MRHPVALCLLLLAACAGEETLPMEFEATPLITLGASAGPGMLGSSAIATRMRDGRWLVADLGAQPAISLFDTAGTFVQTIGRAGDGPGEFGGRLGVPVVLAGDSVLLSEAGTPRALIFGPALMPARTFPLPHASYQIFPSGDGYVMTPANRAPGPFLLQLDGQGQERRRYGPVSDGSQPPPMLATAPDGTVWTASVMRELVIEQYDSAGTLTRTLRPSLAWAPAYRGVQRPTPEQAPGWMIRGFWRDSSGALLLVAKIADERWARGLGAPVAGEGGETSYPVANEDRVYDTMVQALDPVTGAVLASRRFDEAFRFSPFPGVLDRLTVRGDDIRLELTSLQLRPNPKAAPTP